MNSRGMLTYYISIFGEANCSQIFFFLSCVVYRHLCGCFSNPRFLPSLPNLPNAVFSQDPVTVSSLSPGCLKHISVPRDKQIFFFTQDSQRKIFFFLTLILEGHPHSLVPHACIQEVDVGSSSSTAWSRTKTHQRFGGDQVKPWEQYPDLFTTPPQSRDLKGAPPFQVRVQNQDGFTHTAKGISLWKRHPLFF